jgi:hypothetical protein
MRSPDGGTANCPVCELCVVVRKNGITPKHGHIKYNGKWLPPCPGSGKKAKYIHRFKEGRG